MTVFHNTSSTPISEKRNISGVSMPSIKSTNSNSHFPQKLRNFFRINSSSHGDKSEGSLKVETKTSFRQSKFFPGRNRTNTVASEGNHLDDAMSPTAQANPYFAHQGPPALRHHNDGSVPPSPPDTPTFKLDAASGANDQATTANREELARKLRRVASAPNAQGLFSKSTGNDERPATAELGKEPVQLDHSQSTLSLMDPKASGVEGHTIPIPGQDQLGDLQPPRAIAFRRTYSSNSIKIRNVEVGPGSFDKIKLIGKGDVGKVYLVREKKSSRLYAMKGTFLIPQ